MTAGIFDAHQVVRRLEAAGIKTQQAEAIISEMHDTAGSTRASPNRGPVGQNPDPD